ncbi:iron-siderophore ABC transporter substrate-binding protein [Anaerobacillus alkaliphilus]|uniref:Iron-siderophore ABC transporter substrate-binding protein n=1 Tax=Anaerobacillus alkaliphilus TaxID=1548597 RepID=A0A4Q0VV65_9BACI|nr:iron-siderophore ABC transporter substrate-binding protein [Anaerobacillus alkaliphilus]RXJ02750.1 iron-siderophore ABC transporter substrate-binding protein [Anaerobacillus alkaliphilus]
MSKFLLMLVSILVSFAVVIGCSAKTEEATTTEPAKTEEVTKDTVETKTTEVRVVEHAMGKTEIAGSPQKVVVLYNGMVDISLALGVTPVGAVESWLEKPFYNYLKDQMVGVMNLGEEGQPNLEAIATLQPDLIIGSVLRDEKIYEQLSKIAPTVFSESVFDWKENMTLAAKALGKEDADIAFKQEWDNKVADIQAQMGDKLKDTEVSIVRFDPDHSRIYYTGFAGTILAEVGFSRPENQRVDEWGVKLTTKESIPEMNGDVIFDITSDWLGDGAVYKTKEDWTSHALWKNLDAVKNDQVFEVDAITWNMSGGATAAMMMLDDLYTIFNLKK